MASASDPVLTLVWEFINEQVLGSKYCVAPTIDQVNLTGRIVCVTGANTGLGFEAAIHLLRLNPAKLIIGVRSLEKGNAAKDRMMLRVPEYKGEIAVEELDLGKSSILTFSPSSYFLSPRLTECGPKIR